MSAAPLPRLPYPGLRAFRREETDLFFGREPTVNAMVRRLAESRFLAVLGSSGSGKSSLMRTGLFDALEIGLMAGAGARWRIIETRPGGAPLANLAEALLRETPGTGTAEQDLLAAFLARGPRGIVEWAADGHLTPGENLLIFVDQFEELFRFDSWARREEAEAFVGLLIEASRAATLPIHVVLTMRSEYLGAAALLRGLSEALNAGQFLTPRLTRAQCEEAIRGPAEVCGIDIKPDLVARLLNDLEGFAPWEDQRHAADPAGQLDRLARQADQLPLLQHALNWLCERARQRGGPVELTLEDYKTIGGLSGALDAHADAVLRQVEGSLGARGAVAARVFRALVSGRTVADAVRRPTRMAELAELAEGDMAAVSVVVEAFRAPGCNFLLPDERRTLAPQVWVDISHESLIRQWHSFSDWVEAEAEDVRFWTRLVEQARDAAAGRAGLLSGRDLRRAVEWQRKARPSAGWAARLGPPEEHAQALAYLAESRRRARMTLGAGVAALAILLAGATGLWFDRAAREAALATEREQGTLARNRALAEERDRLADAGELFGVTLAGERQRNGDWDGAGRLLAGLLPPGAERDAALLASLQEPLIAQYAFGGHGAAWVARSSTATLVSGPGTQGSPTLSGSYAGIRAADESVPFAPGAAPLQWRPSARYVLRCTTSCEVLDGLLGASRGLPITAFDDSVAASWVAPDGGAAAFLLDNDRIPRVWSVTVGRQSLPPLPGPYSMEVSSLIADSGAGQVAAIRGYHILTWAGPGGTGTLPVAPPPPRYQPGSTSNLIPAARAWPDLLALASGRLLLVLDQLPDRPEAGTASAAAAPAAAAGRGVAAVTLGPEAQLHWVVPPPLLGQVFTPDRPGTALLGLRLHAAGCQADSPPRPLADLARLPEGEAPEPGRQCLVEVEAETGLARVFGVIATFDSLQGLAMRGNDGTLQMLRFPADGTPARPLFMQPVGAVVPSLPAPLTRPATTVTPGGFDPGGRAGESLVDVLQAGDVFGFVWQRGGRMRVMQAPLAEGASAQLLAEFDALAPVRGASIMLGSRYVVVREADGLRAYRGTESRILSQPDTSALSCPRLDVRADVSSIVLLGRAAGRDWFGLQSEDGTVLLGLADPWEDSAREPVMRCPPATGAVFPWPAPEPLDEFVALTGRGGEVELLRLGETGSGPLMLELGEDRRPRGLSPGVAPRIDGIPDWPAIRTAVVGRELGLVVMTNEGALAAWGLGNGRPSGAPRLTSLGQNAPQGWHSMTLRGRRILLLQTLRSDNATHRALLLEAERDALRPIAAGSLAFPGRWPETQLLGLAEDGETILALSEGAPVRMRLPRLPGLPAMAAAIRAREFLPGSEDAAMLAVAARLLRSGSRGGQPVQGSLPCATRLDGLLLRRSGLVQAQAGEACQGDPDAWSTAILQPGAIDSGRWPRAASLALAASLAGVPAAPAMLGVVLRDDTALRESELLATLTVPPAPIIAAGWPGVDRAALHEAARQGSAAALLALAARDAGASDDLPSRAVAFAQAAEAESLARRAGLGEIVTHAAELRARLARLLPDTALNAAPPRPAVVPRAPTPSIPADDAARRRQDLAALAAAAASPAPPPWVAPLRLQLALLRAEAGDPDRDPAELEAAAVAFGALSGGRNPQALFGAYERLSSGGHQAAATALVIAALATAERGADDDVTARVSAYGTVLHLLAEEQARGVALGSAPGLGVLETLFAAPSDSSARNALLTSDRGAGVLERRLELLAAARERRPEDVPVLSAWIETVLWRAEALERVTNPPELQRGEAARLRAEAAAALAELRAAGRAPDMLLLVAARATLRQPFTRFNGEAFSQAAADLAALRTRGSPAASAEDLVVLERQLLDAAFIRAFHGTGAPEPTDAEAAQRLLLALHLAARRAALHALPPALDTQLAERPGRDLAAWAAGHARLARGEGSQDACALALPHPWDPDRAGPGRWLDTLDAAMIEVAQRACEPTAGQAQGAPALYARSRLAAHLQERQERRRLLREAAVAGHRHAIVFLVAEAEEATGPTDAAILRALDASVRASILREGYAPAAALLRPVLATDEDRAAFAWLTREAALAGSAAAHQDLAEVAATPQVAARHLLLGADRLSSTGEDAAAAQLRARAATLLPPEALDAAAREAMAWPAPPPQEIAPQLQALFDLFDSTP